MNNRIMHVKHSNNPLQKMQKRVMAYFVLTRMQIMKQIEAGTK